MAIFVFLRSVGYGNSCVNKMYEREFKYIFVLFSLVGMHPMKKMIKPLVIFNFILTLYITILILLRLLLDTDLVVMESVGVFSQVLIFEIYNFFSSWKFLVNQKIQFEMKCVNNSEANR